MTLVRNNINVRETKTYMKEAEYLEVKVTIRESSLNNVNYYCSNDKMLSLDTIQMSDSNFLMVGDSNSQSQSRKHMTHSQEQERRLRQTPARRTISNSSKVKKSISEQSLNAREGDGEKIHHLLIWKRTQQSYRI